MRHPIVVITALLLIIAVELVVMINYDSVNDDINAITNDYMIRVSEPNAGDMVSSPLRVAGRAKGTWFYEGGFPITLTDWDGRIIAEGLATAKGDWTSKGYILFEGSLDFEKPAFGRNGLLILQSDDPSDLSDNSETLEIPVNFE